MKAASAYGASATAETMEAKHGHVAHGAATRAACSTAAEAQATSSGGSVVAALLTQLDARYAAKAG